jgi:hypothetical protein
MDIGRREGGMLRHAAPGGAASALSTDEQRGTATSAAAAALVSASSWLMSLRLCGPCSVARITCTAASATQTKR